MKLAVVNSVFTNRSLEEALAYLSALGVDSLEVGAGGYPGDQHLKPEEIIDNPAKAEEMKQLFEKYHMDIACISCHGNPLHPQKEIAEGFHNAFKNAILAAEMLDVHTIVGFSGHMHAEELYQIFQSVIPKTESSY